MKVEFGWVGGGVQTHFHVKPNSVEVVLRLSWGCDNIEYNIKNNIIDSIKNKIKFSTKSISRQWIVTYSYLA